MNIVTWPYVLRSGHNDDPSQGACAMDAVNWLVHGKHGDAPECACPIIRAFVIPGNDSMPDHTRQRLLQYLPRIAGSRSKEHEATRLRVAVMAALRVFAPAALDAAGLMVQALRLRALPDDVPFAAAAEAANAAYRAAARAAARAADRTAYATDVAAAAADCAAAATAYAYATDCADCAAAEAARAARAAHAAAAASNVWDLWFATLDQMLTAGPQGEPWSADIVDTATSLYRKANGVAELVS